ncbi:MAG: hypothetical protein JW936_03465 [Sedimentisphaerales bacterium]|nr:hypothetical protein [Sedimentisphaerales bacterium]
MPTIEPQRDCKKMNHTPTPQPHATWQGDMLFGILSTKHNSTRFTASADSLILEGPLGKKFELPAQHVKMIEPGKWSIWFLSGLIHGCIKIHHDITGIPTHLLSSTRTASCHEVTYKLKELGYNVA